MSLENWVDFYDEDKYEDKDEDEESSGLNTLTQEEIDSIREKWRENIFWTMRVTLEKWEN